MSNITIHLTPAEHAFLLLKLGRGTGSTIRPGESLSAEEVLRLTEKVELAGEEAASARYDGICDFPGCNKDATEENLCPPYGEWCAQHATT